MTPYTTRTGVRIGLTYTSPSRPHHDTDALRLQEALLAGRQPRRSGNGFVLAAARALLAVLVFSGCTSDVDTYAAVQADLAELRTSTP